MYKLRGENTFISVNQLLWVGLLGLVLCSCGGITLEDQGSLPNTRVFMAQDIDHRQIQFIWIELPADLDMGDNTLRVFMTRVEPPGMLVPTETELPCILQSEDEYLDLRPIPLHFEYDGETLIGNYTWNACPSCIECYMDWDTTMEIVAEEQQDKLDLSIGIRHMGHNIQDDYFEIELQRQKPSSKEPRMMCRSASDCKELEFVRRP